MSTIYKPRTVVLAYWLDGSVSTTSTMTKLAALRKASFMRALDGVRDAVAIDVELAARRRADEETRP